MAIEPVRMNPPDDRPKLPPGSYRFKVTNVRHIEPNGVFDDKPQWQFIVTCVTDPARIRPAAPAGKSYNPELAVYTKQYFGSAHKPTKLRPFVLACLGSEGFDLLQAWDKAGGLWSPEWLVGMQFSGQVDHVPSERTPGLVTVKIVNSFPLEDTTDNLERLCFALEAADADLYAKVAEAVDRTAQPALIGSASAL